MINIHNLVKDHTSIPFGLDSKIKEAVNNDIKKLDSDGLQSNEIVSFKGDDTIEIDTTTNMLNNLKIINTIVSQNLLSQLKNFKVQDKNKVGKYLNLLKVLYECNTYLQDNDNAGKEDNINNVIPSSDK